MSYAAITSRRMPYDIDGTVVGYGRKDNGIVGWFTPSQLTTLNSSNRNGSVYGYEIAGSYNAIAWFFFPEKREIEQIWGGGGGAGCVVAKVEGSNDTTNGLDGTWETAVLTGVMQNTDDYSWRSSICAVAFGTNYKVIRVSMSINSVTQDTYIGCLHLYGCKAAGETPDDILFCDSAGNELTALMDWGDRPEATTAHKSFWLQNASSSKTANGINIQLNDTDFLISFDGSTWQATLNIPTLAAGQISQEIHVMCTVANPNQTLGPRVARAVVTITSWS